MKARLFVSSHSPTTLLILAIAIFAIGLSPFAASADPPQDKILVGLQLYSLRKACEKDLPGTLQKVAERGYDGVEFAGYYGYSAAELKKMLDDNGLKCCGTHIRRKFLEGDELQKTIDFNKGLGNRYLIVSWMRPSYGKSPQAVEEMAKFYNETAKKAAEQGMLIGYHAHAGDFDKAPGTDEPVWNKLFEKLDPQIVMQLDVGNCQSAGTDPIAVLKKFPGRATTIHLKECGGDSTPVVGEGEVDWKAVFDICKKDGTQWMIVEYEKAPNSFEVAEKCLQNVREMAN